MDGPIGRFITWAALAALLVGTWLPAEAVGLPLAMGQPLAVGLGQAEPAYPGTNLAPASSPFGNGPRLWVTPQVLDFGPVAVGSVSPEQRVTVRNTGGQPLGNFSSRGVNAPFLTSSGCTGEVAPGEGKCFFGFQFAPTEVGPFSTQAVMTSNAGTFIVELRGTGVGPQAHASATAIDFGPVLVGSPSAAPGQRVTLYNTGPAPLGNFSGGGTAAPFGTIHNCISGAAPGGSCYLDYSFTPTEAGLFTTTSTFSTSAGSFTVTLKGIGTTGPLMGPLAWASPLAVDFGPVGLGGTRAVDVTVTSGGSEPVADISGGGVSLPFGASNNCTAELAPGQSCKFTYTFTPDAPGTFTATSTISTSGGSLTISLRGSGVGAKVSATPLKLDFGLIQTGSAGEGQSVTVKNVGKAGLTDIAVGASAPFAVSGSTCSGSLAPGASCMVFFAFEPEAAGGYTTEAVVNTGAGPVTVHLTGMAFDRYYFPLMRK